MRYYYVYRSAKTGRFISELKFFRSNPATVYKEKRLRRK